MDVLLQAVLLLAVLLPGAPLPGAPLPPTPRELARAVLEAHGHDAGSQLRLLRLQGVSRTVGASFGFPIGFWDGGSLLTTPNAVVALQKFDWGTHFTINLTARETCTAPRRAACRAQQGQVGVGYDVGPPSTAALLPLTPHPAAGPSLRGPGLRLCLPA